jgi:hypothetical protein
MKRSGIAVFSISALGFLLGLAQDSSSYAQIQSQPQAAACPLEGPSIADTLKYINDALTADGDIKGDPNGFLIEHRSLDAQGDKLVFIEHVSTLKGGEVSGPSWWTHEIYPVYSLDCKAEGHGYERYHVIANCVPLVVCAKQILNFDDGTSKEVPSSFLYQLNFDFAIDGDHGERLARALSHLLALLQQQYKQSRADPNDPFSKPPS